MKRWQMMVLFASAMMVSITAWGATDDDDDPDLEDYINGIGSCYAPYSTDLNGYVYTADGKTKLTSVTVHETRGTRVGASFFTVSLEKSSSLPHVIITSGLITGLPCRVRLSEQSGVYTADVLCDLTLQGDKYVGMIYGTISGGSYDGCQLKAVTAGVDINTEPTVNPKIAFTGMWGAAFMPSACSGAGADSVSRGFPFLMATFKSSGKISVTAYFPNGFKSTVAGSYATEGNNTVFPVAFSRKVDSGTESFSCKLVWDNQYTTHGLSVSEAFSVKSVSAWTCTGKTAPFSVKPFVIANGRPGLTTVSFKTTSADIDLPDGETLLKSSVRYTSKTGFLTGTVTTSSYNGKKTVKTSRTVYGVDIGGTGWGFIFKKKTTSGWFRQVK